MEETISRNGEDWCFGMVSNITISGYKPSMLSIDSIIISLNISEPNLLSEPGKAGKFGEVDERMGKILCTLQAQENILLQLCSKTTSRMTTTGSKRKRKQELVASLNVMIYGPPALYDSVGKYLSECGLYLQDPLYCDRDVIYRNPQLFTRTQEDIMTSSFIPSSTTMLVEQVQPHADLFELLGNVEKLPETEVPHEVATPLYRQEYRNKRLHQKQALTFMVRREQGFSDDGSDELWTKSVDSEGKYQFTNTITDAYQFDPPPQFRGGLLADSMGLGKSLSMIALVVLNQKKDDWESVCISSGVLRKTRSTLVVVPYSLMQTWHTQLERHLSPNTLIWCTYHGAQKRKISSISKNDVVITTYETLVRQRKRHDDPKCVQETLFSYSWHRVVLDEAHIIRNRSTSRAQAAYAVHATHRWAISGTPIQNKLSDFASLLEFLRVYPFSDAKVFDSEIAKPWLRSTDQDLARLKKLVNYMSLCRTKSVVNLPKREDEIHSLEFSPSERELYESAKIRTSQKLDDALAVNPLQPGSYVNALQWLNQLRLICNHGHMQTKKGPESNIPDVRGRDKPWDKDTAQIAFSSLVSAGVASCSMCMEEISEANLESTSMDEVRLRKPVLSSCLILICGSCLQEREGEVACCKNTKCKGFEVTWSETNAIRPAAISKVLPKMSEETIPTKLKALMTSLKGRSEDDKSVVFSYWTYTLDLVESLFEQELIRYTRIDGQLSSEKRGEAIQQFQNDKSVQVILVSITCGGAGLDLTAASYAYLLEPQWNPMMEEQALCRIHRLGQKQDVKTIRYRMRNSFEEKVVLTQEMKRNLAELTFSSEDQLQQGSRRLQYLRAVLK